MGLRETTYLDLAGAMLPGQAATKDPAPLEGSLFKAAMRTENIIGSMAAFYADKPGPSTPKEVEALRSGEWDWEAKVAPEHEDYKEFYAKHATNQRTFDWVTGLIEREQTDKQRISEGGISGFLAVTAAAMTSPEQAPTYFIPGALVLNRTVLAGSRASTLIGIEAAVGAGSAALGESLLHPTQATRTGTESAFAIAGSAIFAGLITGGVVGWKGVSKSAQEAAAQIDNDIKIMDMDTRLDEMDPRSMGAAESKADIVEKHRVLVERADRAHKQALESGDELAIAGTKERYDELSTMRPEKLTELKHPVLAKVIGKLSPAVRLAGARISSVRELSAMLIDDPMTRVINKYGDNLEMSIESRMTVFEQSMGHKLVEAMDTSFKLYKKAVKEAGEKAVSREDFASEIAKAMRNNDESLSGNSFVSKVAKIIRSEISDPIQARLDAQDMLDRKVADYGVLTKEDLQDLVEPDLIPTFFKEDGTPKANIKSIPAEARDALVAQGKLQTEIRTPVGDESYLHRLWDFEAIRLEPELFEAKISDYFFTKSEEVIRLNTTGKVDAKIVKLEADLVTLDAGLAKSKKRGKVVERTYAERQAEIDKLKAKRKLLREAGEDEAAAKLKTPKRTNAQRAYDLRQEIKHNKDVDLPNAQRKYDADVVVAKRQAEKSAYDLRLKLEGEQYNPTMGADRSVYEVGPLKARVVSIPTNVISDFVENDIEKVMHQYVRGVNAQLHFKETFDPSSPSGVKVGKTPQSAGSDSFKVKMENVQHEYEAAAKLAATGVKNEDGTWKAKPDKKEAAKIRKEWTDVKRDTSAMHELLFDKYKLPDNPSGFWSQARQRLREFNMMTMLGMMTISALPDIGNYIARRGMMAFARDMGRLATNMKALKISAQMNKRMGLSFDLMNSSRIEAMYGSADTHVPISKQTTGGKVLRGWKNTQNAFTQATGMPMWNNFWKSMSATSFIDDVLIDAMKLRKGQLSEHSIEQYARGGLGIDNLNHIAKQLDAERDMIDGVWVPQIDKWADTDIANTFQAAIRKEVDTIVVTPGKGDLPLSSRGEVGKLVFQFKSFSMAANNRILLASLDDFTADKVAGLLAMTTLGYMSYVTRQTLKGKDFETDYDTFVREGLDRSGALAIWGELNAMASKATTGEVDAYRLLGADKATLTRYASRNMLGAMMGVSAGRVQDLGQISSALASGKFKETDLRAARRLLIMNNLWFTHRGFTEIEKSLGGSK